MNEHTFINVIVGFGLFFLAAYIRSLEKTLERSITLSTRIQDDVKTLTADFHVLTGEHRKNHE